MSYDGILIGVTGATGPQGNQGSPGVTGTTGPQGSQGSPGVTGATGVPGAQGNQGSPGVTGVQGIQGLPGVTGVTGSQGQQGSPGVTGVTGATGAVGSQGIQGSPGVTGVTGAVGSQGIQGSPGVTGLTGAAGPQGTQGSPGITGVTGAVGSQGPQGSPGVTGVTGAAGSQGVQGSPGVTGFTGPQGSTGPQGVTGAAGVIGFNGGNAYSIANGFTQPAIGNSIAIQIPSGQWMQIGQFVFIPSGGYYQVASGAVPTFSLKNLGYSGVNIPVGSLVASGFGISPGGIAGITGATGPQGVTGLQGATGLQGSTGIQGPTGSAGLPGATGPAGISNSSYGILYGVSELSLTGTEQPILWPTAGPINGMTSNVATGGITILSAGTYQIVVDIGILVSSGTGPNTYITIAANGTDIPGAAIEMFSIGSTYMLGSLSFIYVANANDVITIRLDGFGSTVTYLVEGEFTVNAVGAGLQGSPGPTGPAGAPQGSPGPTGPAGAQGATGVQGPTGVQGVTGPAGIAASVYGSLSIQANGSGVNLGNTGTYGVINTHWATGESLNTVLNANSGTIQVSNASEYFVHCNLSTFSGDGSQFYQFAFFVNNSIITSTIQKIGQFPSNQFAPITISAVLALNANDIVDVRVACTNENSTAAFVLGAYFSVFAISGQQGVTGVTGPQGVTGVGGPATYLEFYGPLNINFTGSGNTTLTWEFLGPNSGFTSLGSTPYSSCTIVQTGKYSLTVNLSFTTANAEISIKILANGSSINEDPFVLYNNQTEGNCTFTVLYSATAGDVISVALAGGGTSSASFTAGTFIAILLQTGPQGIQGTPGVTGPTGSIGLQGSPGITGVQGPTGPAGAPQGSPGVTGPMGVGVTNQPFAQAVFTGVQPTGATFTGIPSSIIVLNMDINAFSSWQASLDIGATGVSVALMTVEGSIVVDGIAGPISRIQIATGLGPVQMDLNYYPQLTGAAHTGYVQLRVASGGARIPYIFNGNIAAIGLEGAGPTGPQGIQGPTGPIGQQGASQGTAMIAQNQGVTLGQFNNINLQGGLIGTTGPNNTLNINSLNSLLVMGISNGITGVSSGTMIPFGNNIILTGNAFGHTTVSTGAALVQINYGGYYEIKSQFVFTGVATGTIIQVQQFLGATGTIAQVSGIGTAIAQSITYGHFMATGAAAGLPFGNPIVQNYITYLPTGVWLSTYANIVAKTANFPTGILLSYTGTSFTIINIG